MVTFYALATLPTPWFVRVPASVLAGLSMVRCFIFFHDVEHKAIFVGSPLGLATTKIIGFLLMSPPSIWKESHDIHHQNNSKLLSASVGSYPIVTVGMWKVMKPSQRWKYRAVRHPLNMVFGYFTVFLLGMAIAPFLRNPRQHWQGPVAIAVHMTWMGAVAWWGGPLAAFLGVFLPCAIATAVGSYLFYAQHNFPSMDVRDRKEWDYNHAALRSSSLFHMSEVMHWLTGEIGFHHVHHLNHKVPFYRLREAMAGIEELSNPGTTTWAWRDVRDCLNLAAWDPVAKRMLTWTELEARMAAGG